MTRLLCIGDMHLGRHVGVTPEQRESVDASRIRPTEAWRRAVDAAIAHRVDAVLLAGDVVDDNAAVLEVVAPFEEGIRRLVAAGIDVVAVAGNHDTTALPRVADHVPGFRLLGRGGEWQLAPLANGAVRVLGWSFVDANASADPLTSLSDELRAEARQGSPVIGLLHCDLDAGRSPYAPVSRQALQAAPGAGWLLGHIHAPADFASGARIGYLGSLMGLDPTETGVHGPWLVEVEHGSIASMRQLETAPLRWAAIEVDVSDCGNAEDMQDRVLAGIQNIGDIPDGLDLVGVRVRLTGRVRSPREIAAAFGADTLIARQLAGRTRAFVESVRWDAVRIDHDLEEMAQNSDPPGVLANLMLELVGDAPSSATTEALVDRVADAIEKLVRPHRAGIAPPGDARETARRLLMEVGPDVLDRLLETKASAVDARGGTRQ